MLYYVAEQLSASSLPSFLLHSAGPGGGEHGHSYVHVVVAGEHALNTTYGNNGGGVPESK